MMVVTQARRVKKIVWKVVDRNLKGGSGVCNMMPRYQNLAPQPEPEDMELILSRVNHRVSQYLVKKGCYVDEPEGIEPDAQPAVLDILQAASIRGIVGLSNTPRMVPVVGRDPVAAPAPRLLQPFTAEKDGWSIHAGVRVEAGAKEKLEKVCRYLLRPPFAVERLRQLTDGRIAYRFRKARWDGGTEIVLGPIELIEKLAALVPPPRAHTVRYHGVLGPHGGLRGEVVPAQPEHVKNCDRHAPAPSKEEGELPRRVPDHRTPRIDWATLLKRTFGLDVLECSKCGGRMKVIACITEAEAI